MNSKRNRPFLKFGLLPTRSAIGLLVGVGLGLAACAPDADGDATVASASDAEVAVATSVNAATSGSMSYTTDLPDGVVARSAEAAAWEALMGVDGEYAAFAMYGAVIDEFGSVEPYVTIQQQEGRHIEALIRQLDRMRIAVPDNPYIGAAEAPADLQQAAQNWADGEVRNVAMYDDLMLDAADDPRLTRVLTNLRRASQEHHLPMFTAAAAADGTLDDAAMQRYADAHEQAAGDMQDGDGQHGETQHDGRRDGDGGSGPNIVGDA